MAYPNGGTYPSATNTSSYGNVTSLIAALPARATSQTIEAAHMNLVQAEVIEIEQALGSNSSLLADPAGGSAYADLASKLAGIYSAIGSSTTGHNGATSNVHGVGTGDVVGTTKAQTLTSKTLTTPVINGGTINADSLSILNVAAVDVSSTQTLTNKTLTSPTIVGTGTIAASTITATTITATTNLTVDGKAVLTTGGLDGSSLASLTLTSVSITSGSIDVATLRKGGLDAATLAGTETLSNKTLSSPTISGTVGGNFTFGGTVTFTNAPSMSGVVPAGTVIMYAGNGTVPTGWLECDGASYAYSSYTALGAALGVSSGNFTVPNLNNTFVRGTTSSTPYSSGFTAGGSSSITLTKANIPQHIHTTVHDHVVAVGPDLAGGIWRSDVSKTYARGHSHTGFHRSDFAGGGAGNWDVARPESGGGFASEGNKPEHPTITSGSDMHTHAVDIMGQSSTVSGNGSADGLAGSPVTNVLPPYVALRFLIKT